MAWRPGPPFPPFTDRSGGGGGGGGALRRVYESECLQHQTPLTNVVILRVVELETLYKLCETLSLTHSALFGPSCSANVLHELLSVFESKHGLGSVQ